MSDYFIPLKEIEKIARNEYLTKNNYSSFFDIIKYVSQNVSHLDSHPKFRRADTLLSDTEFYQHICTQPVNISAALRHWASDIVTENNIVPKSKDIFTTIHLPFIREKLHTHDYFEINYVYSGTCLQFFEDEKTPFTEGSLIIIAPNSPHSIYTDDGSIVLCFNIRQSTFNTVFWQILQSNDVLSTFFKHSLFGSNSNNYLTFTVKNSVDYQQIVQQIFDETSYDDDFSNRMSINLMNIFFINLLRDLGNTIHLYDKHTQDSFSADFPAIIQYVRHNYSTVNLTILSSVFHYSEFYISKMFKKNLGQNFSSLLQKIKLQHAKNYLDYSNHTISEITELVGYESSDHLSRTFKKMYHLTPSQYRKTNEKENPQ
ncbi:MAG: AraC family transcriptional regulator [Lachnospiraceae bacterium]